MKTVPEKEKIEKKPPMTWRRFLKGFFQWQTLLVSSAFVAMFAFMIYICGNISAPFRLEMNSAEYKALEQTYLIIFIVGVVAALLIAIFAAYMVDHPRKLIELFSRKKKSAAAAQSDCGVLPNGSVTAGSDSLEVAAEDADNPTTDAEIKS